MSEYVCDWAKYGKADTLYASIDAWSEIVTNELGCDAYIIRKYEYGYKSVMNTSYFDICKYIYIYVYILFQNIWQDTYLHIETRQRDSK